MTDLEKAARMALEALERCVATCFDRYAHEQVMSRPEHFVNQAITALRQALEQPARQEPVAWKHPVTADVFSTYAMAKKACCVGQEPIPLTSPQRKPWVGLTDEERKRAIQFNNAHEALAVVIEAKLKEKNT
jgi:hypothetical protein